MIQYGFSPSKRYADVIEAVELLEELVEAHFFSDWWKATPKDVGKNRKFMILRCHFSRELTAKEGSWMKLMMLNRRLLIDCLPVTMSVSATRGSWFPVVSQNGGMARWDSGALIAYITWSSRTWKLVNTPRPRSAQKLAPKRGSPSVK